MKKQPLQPIYTDVDGKQRFQENEIVEFMLEAGRRGETFHLKSMAAMGFPAEDFEQLVQLVGYTLSSFSELSFVSKATIDEITNGEWVALTERGPQAEDFDDFREIFAYHPKYGVCKVGGLGKLGAEGFTYWKRTGFKKPQPPSEVKKTRKLS